MTLEEYYRYLATEWDKVNKNNLSEIQQYNRMKSDLRHIIMDEEESRTHRITACR